jgi:ATP phosphoribosyltransferase
VLLIESLGFGSANVVVAVPQAWIDVRTMADLDDVATSFRAQHNHRMRVATKYINLTRNFFAFKGVVDYRIVESAGATEGAPAAGSAELIVDITTTGATLAANGLKVLDDGVILRSHANLVASRGKRHASFLITSQPRPVHANTRKSARALPGAMPRC